MPTSKMTTHLIDRGALYRMIARVRRGLVQYIRRRPSQLHPVSLESQITYPGLILSIVILYKQCQILNFPKQSSFDLYILHFGCLRKLELLYRSGV